MTMTGFNLSPTVIANAVASGSLSEAEAKLKNVEEVLQKASKEWEKFTSGENVRAFNAGRPLSSKQLTDLVVGVYHLVRGAAMVLSAEHAALTATVQALKSVNMKS